MNPNFLIHKTIQKQNCGTQYRSFLQIFHIDLTLLIGLLVLMTCGFFILYSASNQQLNMVIQEILHIGLGMLMMVVLAQLPPYLYKRWSPWLYGLGIILLIAVLIIGKIDKGAQRWLNLGLFRIQPSEIMKLVIPMMLAWYYSSRELPPQLKDLAISAGIILVPVILTLKQPDLGTAIVLAMGGVCVLLFAGIRWRIVLLLVIVTLLVLPIAWHFLHYYQQQRILTFFNPERDPLGAGYHIIQSKIAIGSGGIFGKGWLQGSQSHLHFLPEHATDFIFAVTGEEFGLLGSILLLIIYLYITVRCMFIAYRAQDTFTRLLASSLTLMFFLSVFVNMGMVSGILPVVGLPLPLISYGGSSMITIMASFGILMSIQGHRTLLDK